MIGLVVLLALGCSKAQEAPPAEPGKALRLKVSRRGHLGTVDVPIGGPAAFSAAVENEEATQLRALVDELAGADSVSVEMHQPQKDGSRGPLGMQVWRRGTPGYGEGVRTKLQEQGYEVEDLP
jgi:hypothetical protein